MDALIKSLRPAKPSDGKISEAKIPESRPAELDPSELLAAAVRADQPRPSRAEAEVAVQTLLGYIGENPEREGLLDTPRRVVEAFDELYQGYHQCPAEVLDRTFGETAGYDDFVLIRDIEFTSQCEHHMMPFYGKAHSASKPVERVEGVAASLHVGARRRQAWRDDVHQPLYRHVPRQSGGAGTFPVHGARGTALTSLRIREDCPCPHPQTSMTARKGWHSSPNSMRPVSSPASPPMLRPARY